MGRTARRKLWMMASRRVISWAGDVEQFAGFGRQLGTGPAFQGAPQQLQVDGQAVERVADLMGHPGRQFGDGFDLARPDGLLLILVRLGGVVQQQDGQRKAGGSGSLPSPDRAPGRR